MVRSRGAILPGLLSRLLAVAVVAVTASSVAACAANEGPGDGSPGPDDGTLTVVATSTVFADMVRGIGGDRVTVVSLVPAGTDVHTYQAKPDDLRAVARAKLVVMNGLGLDDWLEPVLSAASGGGEVLRLAVDLPGAELLPGDEPGTQNPHLWLDVANARRYAVRIGEALAAVDPGGDAAYRAGVAAYDARLADLDAWAQSQVASIPTDRRAIVTFHDALPYFARAYGLVVVGVAVDAPGQDPSAGEIAALVDAIRESGVQAIFSEDQFPTALVDQIGRETGATVVANLFSDSLGNDPVTSYEALIRWDVERIVEALR